MKKHIRIAIISVLLLGLSAGRVHADDEALAAIGGFFAGVITSAIIDDHNDHDRVRVSVHGDFRDRHRSGHWEIQRVRVWIPGRWKVERNHCGDRVKVWKRGRYEWRRERVWVAYNDRGHRRGYRG